MAKNRKNDGIIQDTRADDILLDVNAPDEDKTVEGLLRLEARYKPQDNMTVSWRIPSELLEWAKDVARRVSVEEKKDIHYQKLIMGCFLEKYPIPKDWKK
jgi:hypothetical protein